MDPLRRGLLLLAPMLATGLPARAQAPAYPGRPIRLVIAIAPGGFGDITVRAVAQKMSKSLGQQVVVDNKPGGGQILGVGTVAKAAPDGYSLIVIGGGNSSAKALYKELPFDVTRDFAYVSSVSFVDLAVFTLARSPLRDLQDLVKAAKEKPGQLNIGTISVGTMQYLTAELMKSLAGIDVVIVPYKSAADVVSAVLSGDVQAGVEAVPALVSQVKAGAVRPLALASPRRFDGLPDVPTTAEAGYPGLLASAWNGIAAPAGTPPAIIEKLNRAVREALASEDIVTLFRGIGAEARGSTPDEMGEIIRSDVKKWAAVIETAKIERQ